MSDITVYPFGQNVQLPSGYPIADDLNTDSAQKALSAKQGKRLGDRVIDKISTVLSSSLTEQNYTIKSGTPPTWQSGKHYAFPVTPGETITLYITSSTTDGSYAGFVSAAYDDVTPANNGKFPLAPGASIFWAYKSSSYELVVPEYAKYLIVVKSTSSYSAESKIERVQHSSLFTDFFEKDKGDELYDGLKGEYEEVDISGLTVSPCYLGASVWTDTGSHVVIPVTPGEKYKLRTIYSSSDGGFYAFLRSSYVAPSSAGGNIPYVSTYGTRFWITYPGTGTSGVEVTVPDGAAYLCVCLLVQSNKTAIWDIKKLVGAGMMSDYIKSSQIVNNTIDGGPDVPLSAEQGKKLASMIVDGIPSGLQKYSYEGAAVRLKNQHYVAKENVSQITSISCQGGACFGNYLFMFADNVATCWMYNLSTQSLVQTISVSSDQRGFVSNAHCNTVNFGSEYYDTNDSFPLLYVSTGYQSNGYSGALVYRVISSTESDVTTYDLVLVQTLKIPGALGWTEFVIGEEGDCYIKAESGGIKYYRMVLPTLSQGDYTFDMDNALAVYCFPPQPTWYNGSRNQGHIYHNGKIYLASGVPTSEASLFIVLDLATCRREVEIDLYNTLGLTSEPEAVFFWNGKICVAFRSNTGIYALYFE